MKLRQLILLLLGLLFLGSAVNLLRPAKVQLRTNPAPTNPTSTPAAKTVSDQERDTHLTVTNTAPILLTNHSHTTAAIGATEILVATAATNATTTTPAINPAVIIRPPPTPLAPPPMEAGRTDTPVIPPGQGRNPYTGP
jgi:hypothetical protein